MTRRPQPTRTALDRENAVKSLLCSPAWEARLADPGLPVELARITGVPERMCEALVNARRAAVERLARGEVVW